MGNNLVFKRSSSGDSHPKSMNGKRKLDDRIELGDNMIINIAPDCCHPESIYKRRRSNQQLEKLPEAQFSKITSESFEGTAMLGSMTGRRQQCTQKFIENVNAVLLQDRFPNQKRLDLHAVYTSGKDLEVVLSNCCGFEWLSILRCQLHDELKVDHPLPSLLYLSVEDSRATPFVENLRVHTERVLVCQERVYH
uniref:At1g61320/AtMIF1 LRR domain-containing protein n=2 Tax=Oryza meridionalis TaxID=40149 RepID=A0A0E0DDR2_9ORYZ